MCVQCIAGAMTAALTYFQTSVLSAATRPAAVRGLQKNYVILLTDGDESCSGNPPARVDRQPRRLLAHSAAQDLAHARADRGGRARSGSDRAGAGLER